MKLCPSSNSEITNARGLLSVSTLRVEVEVSMVEFLKRG